MIVSLAASLLLLHVSSLMFAAEPKADGPRTSYYFTLEVAPKDGPPQRFSFASAEGRLEVRFISGHLEVDGTSIPLNLNFKAEVELLPNGRVSLGQVSFLHTVPYVSGVFSSPPSAQSAIRSIPNRPAGHGDQGSSAANAAKLEQPPGQPAAIPFTTRANIQQQDIGINTSLVLRLGKTITLLEDNKEKVRLTVSEMPE